MLFISRSFLFIVAPPILFLFYLLSNVLPCYENGCEAKLQAEHENFWNNKVVLATDSPRSSGVPLLKDESPEPTLKSVNEMLATTTETATTKPTNIPSAKPVVKPLNVPGQLGDFPAIIWQSTGPKPLSDGTREDIASWRYQNPFFSTHLLTDEQADAVVAAAYAHRPDIVRVFHALPIAILKADLLRYLLLLAYGGVWADTDVKCELGVDKWIPQEIINGESPISLVVGLEFDGDFNQFTNWAILAKPGNKHLQRVVDSIIVELQSIAVANEVQVSQIELEMLTDVVEVTGPRKMSAQIVESLKQDLGRELDHHEYTGLKEPKLISDVLVLPGNAFAATQNNNPEDQGPALVSHHYAGSWKAEADAAREHRNQQHDTEEPISEPATESNSTD